MSENLDRGAQPPIAAHVVAETAARPPRRPSLLGWLFKFFLLMAFFGSLLLNLVLLVRLGLGGLDGGEGRVQEKHFSHERYAANKVAILSIEGTILGADGFFKRQLDKATQDAKDGKLKALVVRVNSPGGTISGSDEIYHRLKTLREETKIPIVVSMGALAASGGYYVSMAVGDEPKTIFAEPSTWTGSIGVIIPHYDLSKLLTTWGVKDDSIVSEPLKGMGSMARPMTEEERKIFQTLVDQGFSRFKEVIRSGRPKFRKDPEALDKLATGQVYTAEEAKKAGLVDEIGFIEVAVDRAIELTGLSPDEVNVVKYKPEPTLADLLAGSSSQGRANMDLAALLDLSAPQAYYLWTRLPPLAAR